MKEMRLHRTGDAAAANALLDGHHPAAPSGAHTADAADSADGCRAVPPGVRLDEVLCEQERRAVGHDWCVRWKNGYPQIGKGHAASGLAGKRVLVRQKRDGRLLLEHDGLRPDWTPAGPRPPRPKAKPGGREQQAVEAAGDAPVATARRSEAGGPRVTLLLGPKG